MKNMVNKIFFLAIALLHFSLCSAKENDILITDVISITNTPLYTNNFQSFVYVNPNAPKGGKIVLPAYGTFDNFNPYIFKGTASTETAQLTLDSLAVTPADDIGSAYPLIAQYFELPKDKSFVGFFINPKARFHDNTPITADDVVFSFNSLITKGSPIYKFYYQDVEKVVKISPLHVRFYIKEGIKNRELPLILSSLKIFSAKDFQNKEYDKPSLTPPLGSGPYKVKNFDAGKYITFERKKDYWAKDLPTRKGFFNFDEIKYDYYQDTTITLQALFAGNIDVRYEYIAKSWATGYNNDLIKNKTIKKIALPHSRPATTQFFAFNTRKEKFSSPHVRKAIELAFNFPWANKNLFYNQYQRLNSFFTNTPYRATQIPQNKELEILEAYKDKLPQEIFTTPVETFFRDDSLTDRENLKLALNHLKQAGYDFINEKMCHLKTKTPLEFEIIINSANGHAFTRVLLPFIENLRKIGIKATTRILEINTYKNKLDKFDFDIIIGGVGGISLPGSEQKDLWGSQSANTYGSNNIIGIQNPVIDSLIQKLIETEDNELYSAYIKALDRVLLFNHYVIFNWYSATDRIAYWDKFSQPDNASTGIDINTWWQKD